MENREKYILERKAKVGWKAFYTLRDNYDRLSSFYSSQRIGNKNCIDAIKSGAEIDINFLKKQFIELYDKVSELTDCPICFETLTKDNMEVPSCGHLVCKNCFCKIENCPLCKKVYYK